MNRNRAVNRLKEQRQMLGWTQHDEARATGIAPGRISFFETGRVQLTDEEMERIKSALAKRAKEVSEVFAVA